MKQINHILLNLYDISNLNALPKKQILKHFYCNYDWNLEEIIKKVFSPKKSELSIDIMTLRLY